MTKKLSEGFHDSHVPHFVQCEQIKFRLKKNVKTKASHSVVAVGIVAGEGGGGGGSAGQGGGGGGGGIHVILHMT